MRSLLITILLFVFTSSCELQEFGFSDHGDDIKLSKIGKKMPQHNPNILKYGAYNDGTHPTETVEAINNQIELGGAIKFPPGIYAVNSDIILKGNVTIIGTKGTVIKGLFDGAFFHGDPLNLKYCKIENLIIEGSGGYDLENYDINPQETGIYIQAARGTIIPNVIIKNVTVRDINGGGIQVKGTENITIENCHVENSNFVAYTLVGKNIILKNSFSDARMFIEAVGSDNNSILSVSNCTATSLYNYGIRYSGAGNAVFDQVSLTGNKSVNLATDYTGMFGFWLFTDYYGLDAINKCEIINCKVEHMHIGIEVDEGERDMEIDSLIIHKFYFPDTYRDLIINGKVNNVVRSN